VIFERARAPDPALAPVAARRADALAALVEDGDRGADARRRREVFRRFIRDNARSRLRRERGLNVEALERGGEQRRADVGQPVGDLPQLARRRSHGARGFEQQLPGGAAQRLDRGHKRSGVPLVRQAAQQSRRLAQVLQLQLGPQRAQQTGADLGARGGERRQRQGAEAANRSSGDQADRPAPGQLLVAREQVGQRQIRDGPCSGEGIGRRAGGHAG
jgi:hypothetical protein